LQVAAKDGRANGVAARSDHADGDRQRHSADPCAGRAHDGEQLFTPPGAPIPTFLASGAGGRTVHRLRELLAKVPEQHEDTVAFATGRQPNMGEGRADAEGAAAELTGCL
jgi:hypothetical protein